MPEYTYCEICCTNPVHRLGDICPDCRRKQEQAREPQKQIDRLYKKLTTKPRHLNGNGEAE